MNSRVLGAGFLVIASLIGVWAWFSGPSNETTATTVSADEPDSTAESEALVEPAESVEEPEEAFVPPKLGQAGELVNLDGWLQTDATSFAEVQGKVTIVQFWTFGCFNCKNTIPHLQEIYADHHDNGLEIVGVHAPEFDFEKDPEAIAAAAVDHGVTWPIALDTNKVNFRAWQPDRRFWPRTFVVDSDGEIRFDKIGEGSYDTLAATVAVLLET